MGISASTLVFIGMFVGVIGACGLFIKLVLKSAESQKNWMAHAVEAVDVPLPQDNADGTSQVDAKVALEKYMTGLRHLVAPFDKMGATLDKSQHETKLAQLNALKSKLAAQGTEQESDVQNMLVEAERNLARYAPKG